MTENNRKTEPGRLFWQTAFWIAVLALFAAFAVKVSSIIGYFALAGAIAYVLNPAVVWLNRRRIPLWAATLAMFVILAGGVTLLLFLVIPPAIEQFNELKTNIPQYFETLKAFWARIGSIAARTDIPVDISSIPDSLAKNLQSSADNIGNAAINGISGFFGTLAWVVIVPILIFYFLSDGPKIRLALISAFPPAHRDDFESLLSHINTALGGFIRGQLKLCLAMGVLTTLAMLPLFPKYAVIFGLIAGITEFIPYVGPILALIGPMIVACFSPVWKIIAVLGVFVVLQLLEGNVLAPRIIGKDVGLHPALIIFVLMCGGQVAGLTGMIAAIPVAVVIKVLYTYFYVDRYLKTVENRCLSNDVQPTSAHADTPNSN